eukprot:jgi/Mesen1/9558/ME000640S08900
MWYKGYYHLFYQYNPGAAVWGNISWGHAVSTDLLQWKHLPLALSPDQWYDAKGIWSGAATLLPDGTPALLYTGWTNSSTQVQCAARPADPGDPLLRSWVKFEGNPIATPPEGVDSSAFRDPTTAWRNQADNMWRILVGARQNGSASVALVYRSADFQSWYPVHAPLHSAPLRTGMWECPDFYPVSLTTANGVDTSAGGPLVRHVLKASFDDDRHDYYAVGTYDPALDTWRAVDPAREVGAGAAHASPAARYDLGKLYASRTFFDANATRRVLWGWVNESDSEATDVAKGWASVQAIPREVRLDPSTGADLLTPPVEELKTLRTNFVSMAGVALPASGRVALADALGSQLDIEAVFDLPSPTPQDASAANELVSRGKLSRDECGRRGSAQGGVLGPFGISVLTEPSYGEQTAVYFEMLPGGGDSNGNWTVRLCSDHTRSSLASDLDKPVYGGAVRVLPSEDSLSLRILVDHSIVESFAQGGRTCITGRSYPIYAIQMAATVVIFNNGSTPITLRNFTAWQLNGIKFSTL